MVVFPRVSRRCRSQFLPPRSILREQDSIWVEETTNSGSILPGVLRKVLPEGRTMDMDMGAGMDMI